MRVVVLADTHAPRRWHQCPPGVAEHLGGADLILHAGDVCTADVLDELAGYAPVLVVQGNNDGADVSAWGATETVERELAGLAVAMVHDAGPPAAPSACCTSRTASSSRPASSRSTAECTITIP